MKKVGSSFKKLGGFFLILVLLFLLFSMFSGSKEGFYDGCQVGDTCKLYGKTCQVIGRDGGVIAINKCDWNEAKKLIWVPQKA